MENAGLDWVGRKVYISLKSGKAFTGHILAETTDNLTILDKFNFRVLINKTEIALLKEER